MLSSVTPCYCKLLYVNLQQTLSSEFTPPLSEDSATRDERETAAGVTGRKQRLYHTEAHSSLSRAAPESEVDV